MSYPYSNTAFWANMPPVHPVGPATASSIQPIMAAGVFYYHFGTPADTENYSVWWDPNTGIHFLIPKARSAGFNISIDSQIATLKSDISRHRGDNLNWNNLERYVRGIHEVLWNIAAFKNRHLVFTADQMLAVRELIDIGKLLYQRACLSSTAMEEFEILINESSTS